MLPSVRSPPPQLHQGDITGAVLQSEPHPQAVDGLDVEELHADLHLRPDQQVLPRLAVLAAGCGQGLSSNLEDKHTQGRW